MDGIQSEVGGYYSPRSNGGKRENCAEKTNF